MSNTHKEVTIINPEQWDIDYDAKRRQWYYKLGFDFFTHPAIYALSPCAKLLFLDIIKQSLRVKSAQLSYCLDSAKGLIRGELDLVKGYLRELKENNIIDLKTTVRRQYIVKNRIEEYSIEQKPILIQKHKVTVSQELAGDFDKLFGLITIRTQKKWLDIYQPEYIQHCASEAETWLDDNPTRKFNGSFFSNWLKRGYEKWCQQNNRWALKSEKLVSEIFPKNMEEPEWLKQLD